MLNFSQGLKGLVLVLFFVSLSQNVEARRRRTKIMKEFSETQDLTEKAQSGDDEDQNSYAIQKKSNREGKLFSPFYIVTFKNEGCRSQSTFSSGSTGNTNRNGTCYTTSECSSRGGSASGGCASGFGVCCIFTVSTSGATINQNCTYIQNPGFPSTLSDTASLTYTIAKCQSNVCSLRLDFESFTLQGTGNTVEVNTDNNLNGGACLDSFMVTAAGSGQTVPTICGRNNGQHMYVDIGNGNSNTATLSFNFDGASNIRQWEIKVTQVPCNTPGHPTGCGCLQYHTGITGRIETFNFEDPADNHLRAQDYSICIRQEAGFCCVQYNICPDTNSFTLDTLIAAMSEVDDTCSFDYIGIEGGSNNCQVTTTDRTTNKFCGPIFSAQAGLGLMMDTPVCDCSVPFQIDIRTDLADDTGDPATDVPNVAQSRGVCLEYRQLPCA